jgi:CO/xanthine dehydrogenase Mo-binding subunit
MTIKTPSGTYRVPGRYEASFFCERLIQLAGGDLGIDDTEMRRRNLIAAAEMPYKLSRLEPGGPAADTECDSGDYGEALEQSALQRALFRPAELGEAVHRDCLLHRRVRDRVEGGGAVRPRESPAPGNPLGVKGAGEGAIIPVGGLIANAVASVLTSFGAKRSQFAASGRSRDSDRTAGLDRDRGKTRHVT